MDFPFSGSGIVEKDLIMEGRNPELKRLSFVAEVRWVWLQKRLQPNILWRLRDSNCIIFSQRACVEDGGTDGSLEMSLCTRWGVHVVKVRVEFL